MRRILVFALLIGIWFGVQAEEALCAISDAAVLFLRIAPNARAAGMGEAFVAVADDASATHWNPAGLGEYPLANAWYQFKLFNDTRLKELASRALQGKLAPEFFEKLASWQVKANEISRYVNNEWITSEKIPIDASKTILANLARRANVGDKENFKLAVRQICFSNTGVSFDDINALRLQMAHLVGKDKLAVGRINTMIEKVLVVWQDLRFSSDSFTMLKEKVSFASADSALASEELTELDSAAVACETGTRPSSISVPYPVLLTMWQGWEVPWEQNIEKIAVMENNIPTTNYSHYDVWALTNFGLARFDGVTWQDGDNIEPKQGDKLRDIIARALGTGDEATVNPRLEMVALANNAISKERLLEIKAQVSAALPDSFEGRGEFQKNLDGLEDAWLGCRLDQIKFDAFVAAFNKAYSDSALTSNETDRLVFALEKSITDRLPSIMRFPFKAVFLGGINDLAVDRKTLFVATETGLYRYNGRSWEKHSAAADSSVAVWCINSTRKGQLWLGTSTGVKTLSEGKWVSYGAAEGLSSLPIKHVYVKNERTVWAASDNDLFLFDGAKWKNMYTYTTTVSDSALSVMTKFYGALDQTRLEMQVAKLQMANPEFYATPRAGEVIDIPYAPLFEGKITALEMDNNDLWVGTELGLKRFDGKSWTSYGYKPIKVERAMTVTELAKEYLKTDEPDRIASFVSILKKKNTLPEGTLQVGRIVYVYANPAGSTIQSLCENGGKMYVASIYGAFSYNKGNWERYYHEGLNQANTKDIVSTSGEMWFATSDRVIIAAAGTQEFTFTHANWLPELASDLYYEFLGYVQPIGALGTVGANVTFLSYGTIGVTSETSSEVTGTINPFDVAFTLSYGTRASKNLAVGLSAKVIYSRLSVVGAGREVGQGSGTSFAAEIGILYSMGKRFRLGAVLTNLGPNMSYIDAAQSDALPRNLAVGVAYRLIDSPYNRLTLVGEINKQITSLNGSLSEELNSAIENVGMEYWYGSLLALRAGYIYDREGQIKTATLGIGLQYHSSYGIDFAYIPSSVSLPLANTLRTSFSIKF
jgi:hypothetical protein